MIDRGCMTIRFNQQKTSPLLPLLFTTALLFLGFMILMLGIDTMHMRPDEELSFRNLSYTLHDSMILLITRDDQAPLWWIQFWAWMNTAGTSEFAGRVNSVLWTMLSFSILYQIGRSWFGERRFGWFTVTAMSVNSYFFIYALEMRMYALGMLVAILSMRVFHTWVVKQTNYSAIIYAISATLMLYTHYYWGFVILAQVAYFLIFHLLDWRMIKQGLMVAAISFLLWVPGILVLLNQLQFIGFSDSGGLVIPTKKTNLETILDLIELGTNGFILLYALILILGLVVLWKKAGYRLALAWLLISPTLVFILNTKITIYNVRYVSFLIPSIGIAIGAAIASFPDLLMMANVKRQEIGKYGQWLILIIVCAISLYNLPNHIPVRVPYRHIFTEINQHYQEGDVLFAYHERPGIYVDDQFNRYLSPELLANQVDTLEEAQKVRRVWYLTDYIFDETSQAIFLDLEKTHRQQAVIGQCPAHSWCYVARLMEAPPLQDPIFFGETLGFLGADVSSIGNNQLPVLLWWMVEKTPEVDYSISLQLIAPDGSLVTQLDRQIDPPDEEIGEIPSSQMQTEGNYLDWRVLDIPSDLANGDYSLQLIVYQWWDGVRLALDNGSDILVLQTITIDR
jgi:hypothetical protein